MKLNEIHLPVSTHIQSILVSFEYHSMWVITLTQPFQWVNCQGKINKECLLHSRWNYNIEWLFLVLLKLNFHPSRGKTTEVESSRVSWADLQTSAPSSFPIKWSNHFFFECFELTNILQPISISCPATSRK